MLFGLRAMTESRFTQRTSTGCGFTYIIKQNLHAVILQLLLLKENYTQLHKFTCIMYLLFF